MSESEFVSVFYFEPQTGLIKNKPHESNFHIYKLPGRCLAKVMLEVESAKLDSGGLTYTMEFLRWLNVNELEREEK